MKMPWTHARISPSFVLVLLFAGTIGSAQESKLAKLKKYYPRDITDATLVKLVEIQRALEKGNKGSNQSTRLNSNLWSLNLRKGGKPVPLTMEDSLDAKSPVWSPSGRWIAYLQGTSFSGYGIRLISKTGLENVEVTDGSSFDNSILWHPDEQSIAFVRRFQVISADLNNKRTSVLFGSVKIRALCAWSKDRGSILVAVKTADTKCKLAELNLATRKLNYLLQPASNIYKTFTEIKLHPKEDRVIYHRLVGNRWNIYERDLALTRSVLVSENWTNDSHPSWSPDGKSIVYASTRDPFRNY